MSRHNKKVTARTIVREDYDNFEEEMYHMDDPIIQPCAPTRKTVRTFRPDGSTKLYKEDLNDFIKHSKYNE